MIGQRQGPGHSWVESDAGGEGCAESDTGPVEGLRGERCGAVEGCAESDTGPVEGLRGE